MLKFDTVLRILMTEGYPNPRLDSIFKHLSYNGENFLMDLVKKFGYDGANEFVRKALDKLSEPNRQDYVIKVPLKYYGGSWVELVITDFYIDEEESDTDVVVSYYFGDSKIINPSDGHPETLDDIYDEMEMGDMNDWEDFKDEIRSDCYNYISQRCGFGIWYQ